MLGELKGRFAVLQSGHTIFLVASVRSCLSIAFSAGLTSLRTNKAEENEPFLKTAGPVCTRPRIMLQHMLFAVSAAQKQYRCRSGPLAHHTMPKFALSDCASWEALTKIYTSTALTSLLVPLAGFVNMGPPCLGVHYGSSWTLSARTSQKPEVRSQNPGRIQE